jgi:hypothetical protein
VIPAAIVVGTALLGQAYAKWQNSMITDPNQIAGGNKALMSSRQMAAFDAMRLAQARAHPGFGGGEVAPNAGMGGVHVTVPVNVDNTRAPGITSAVRPSPPVTHYPGAQYGGAY